MVETILKFSLKIRKYNLINKIKLNQIKNTKIFNKN